MGRSIEQENTFLQVLLKLIPSEVIAVFVFIQGVMPGRFWPHLIMALVLIGLTPFYLSMAGGVKSKSQLVLSTLSLVVWIYAMGTGPLRFIRAPYYEPWHGAVLLAVWTLVPPMLLAKSAPEAPTRPPAKKRSVRRAAARKPSPPASTRPRVRSADRRD
jgi:hypothetical protein